MNIRNKLNSKNTHFAQYIMLQKKNAIYVCTNQLFIILLWKIKIRTFFFKHKTHLNNPTLNNSVNSRF